MHFVQGFGTAHMLWVHAHGRAPHRAERGIGEAGTLASSTSFLLPQSSGHPFSVLGHLGH